MNAALPIVSRELRAGARRKSTYWGRLFGAGVALTVLGSTLAILWAEGGSWMQEAGTISFAVLSWLALLAAGTAGVFLTSDSLSQEKRDGTLGLLFLTDLRGYDVVLGKMAASSLTAFYALVAIMPVLGITLFMGGVSGEEFWRTTLILCNALFLSLAVGLFVSAVSRETLRAMTRTLFLLLFIGGGLPLIDWWRADWDDTKFSVLFSHASPAVTLALTMENAGSQDYWTSMAATHGLAWVFMVMAGVLAPLTWKDSGREHTAKRTWRQYFTYGSAPRRTRLRKALLGRNPAVWLAARERGLAIMISVFLLLWLASFLYYFRESWVDHGYKRGSWGAALSLVKMFLYLWMAAQASRLLVEARRNGALELILSSPLPARQLIEGFWKGLLRVFRVPVVFLLAAGALFAGLEHVTYREMWANNNSAMTMRPLISKSCSSIAFLTNMAALAWTGMWFGLTSTKPATAIIKAILFVQVLPWLPIGLIIGLVMFGIFRFSIDLPDWSDSAFMLVLLLLKNALFIWWARRNLYGRLREVASVGKTKRVRLKGIALPPTPAPASALQS